MRQWIALPLVQVIDYTNQWLRIVNWTHFVLAGIGKCVMEYHFKLGLTPPRPHECPIAVPIWHDTTWGRNDIHICPKYHSNHLNWHFGKFRSPRYIIWRLKCRFYTELGNHTTELCANSQKDAFTNKDATGEREFARFQYKTYFVTAPGSKIQLPLDDRFRFNSRPGHFHKKDSDRCKWTEISCGVIRCVLYQRIVINIFTKFPRRVRRE